MPTSRFFLVRATLAFWVLSVGYAFVQVETMRKVSMAAALYRRQSLSASLGSKGSNQDATASSRRRFLGQMGTLSLVNLIIPSDPAVAAAPITIGESENVGARVRRLLRPKPPKVLRNQLNLDFAVLLMRSSYNALDQIDCVAMDQFQRDFFILRQAEYQPYVNDLGPGLVQQGQLSDPYYFDFISYAQYATINREITQDPPFVFQEQQPVTVGEDEPQTFVSVVIRRDSALANDKLAPEHDRQVGVAILDRLQKTFGDSPSALPKAEPQSRPSTAKVLESLSQLVKLFLLNGYAWDGSASLVSSTAAESGAAGAEFCLRLVAPATLWGGQALQQQRAPLSNDFLLKTAKELVGRMGYGLAASSVKYEGTNELNYLTLR